MKNYFPLMIANAPSKSGIHTVTAPFDGSPIAEIETASFEHVEIALQNAYALYQKRSEWLPPHRRIEILGKAIHIMASQQETLAVEAAREGGKPLIDSRIEVGRAIDGLKICIEHLRTNAGTVIPTNISAASSQRLAFTQKEPIGVVVAVSAFNHPLNLIVHQVGAAITAGCPTIVKPATDTPLSCLRFVQILRDAGLPDAWCQVVVAENREVATKLVTNPRVGFFSFIGSAKIGWMLRSQLAAGTRCALEHGGVAPVIVAQDADLDIVIPSISKGGFYHAGQVCVSVQRVFAHESIARTLAERLATSAKQLKIGDPTQAETDIGPLIRHAEVKRVHEWVSEAIDAGAERLSGGEAISDSCYSATVLFNPPLDAKVSQQEIFGPVVCVYSYKNMDDAITQANSLPYSFQAAVFTKDLDTALRAYKQLDASAIMVNDHTAFRIDAMPFAGLKESGLGVGGIPYTIEDMQVEKLMVIKSVEL